MGLTLLRSWASTCGVQEVLWAGVLVLCFLPFSFSALLPFGLLCSPLDTHRWGTKVFGTLGTSFALL